MKVFKITINSFWISLGILFFFFKSEIQSQQTDSLWIVSSIIEEQKSLWTSPLKINRQSAKIVVPVVFATGISIAKDEKIYQGFKKFQNSHGLVDKISPIVTYGGDNLTGISAIGGFYMAGLISKNEKHIQTGALLTTGLANASAIVITGKLLTSRRRPKFAYAEPDQIGIDKWNFFPAGLKEFTHGHPRSWYDAFPSGHTIAAWTIASVIANQYKNVKWVPPVSYGLATVVGLSRVTEDTHWLSDVLVGATLGYFIGKFMVEKRNGKTLLLFPKSYGINLRLSGIYLPTAVNQM